MSLSRLDRVVQDMAEVKAVMHQIATVQEAQGAAINHLVEYMRSEKAAKKAHQELAKSVFKVAGASGVTLSAVGGAVYSILQAVGIL